MKSPIEISQTISALGWTLYRLSQKTGESESDLRRAMSRPEMRDTRKKIADAVGKSYEEIFGEQQKSLANKGQS